MPPLPPAQNVLKIRYVGANNGSTWNCIMHHLMGGGGPTATELNVFCSGLASAWNAAIAPLCANTVELTEVQAFDLTSPTAAEGNATAAFVGTRTGLPLSAQVALVSSWQANLRYRGGHVRNYWPGGVQPDLANGMQWLPTFITTAASGFTTFRSTVNGISVGALAQQMVLLSYRTGNAARPVPITVPITGVLVHPRIDTQRRRLGKEHP